MAQLLPDQPGERAGWPFPAVVVLRAGDLSVVLGGVEAEAGQFIQGWFGLRGRCSAPVVPERGVAVADDGDMQRAAAALGAPGFGELYFPLLLGSSVAWSWPVPSSCSGLCATPQSKASAITGMPSTRTRVSTPPRLTGSRTHTCTASRPFSPEGWLPPVSTSGGPPRRRWCHGRPGRPRGRARPGRASRGRAAPCTSSEIAIGGISLPVVVERVDGPDEIVPLFGVVGGMRRPCPSSREPALSRAWAKASIAASYSCCSTRRASWV
ncbi:hypothetical protein P3T27_005066 [Kitasatospora sp. MAA19]|nr:hypothetical protein [Kitasatospora sp. MAA19]